MCVSWVQAAHVRERERERALLEKSSDFWNSQLFGSADCCLKLWQQVGMFAHRRTAKRLFSVLHCSLSWYDFFCFFKVLHPLPCSSLTSLSLFDGNFAHLKSRSLSLVKNRPNQDSGIHLVFWLAVKIRSWTWRDHVSGASLCFFFVCSDQNRTALRLISKLLLALLYWDQ